MTRRAYLTIDDSPSPRTRDLVDALQERGISALLFCRGDLAEGDMDALVYAIEKDMVLASHAYNHVPAGDLPLDQACDNILRADALIDICYARAGKERGGKYFRFPYIDRGDGDRVERRFFDLIKQIEAGEAPRLSDDPRVRALQDFLRQNGFVQPFTGITHPLYRVEDIANARDCFFTYSTGDWMLNPRHLGKQALSSLDDIKGAMLDDPYLMNEGGTQIVLVHDHADIFDTVTGIVDFLIEHKFTFEKVG